MSSMMVVGVKVRECGKGLASDLPVLGIPILIEAVLVVEVGLQSGARAWVIRFTNTGGIKV